MKLQGVRVLDLSMYLPGPHLTMTMADHGAEVWRIEPPGEGEPNRNIGWKESGESVYFRNTHRGKRSVVLDLKNDQARELFMRLAEKSDVVVESFRTGVVKRLGIDYDAVARRAPHIVYCSISAFGQTGPLAGRVAHDIAVEAQAGVASLTIGQDGKPTLPAIAMADMAVSLTALSGILMALFRARETGNGDYIDLSMQDALMAWTPNITGRVFAEKQPPQPRLERTWGGNALYNLYETADGKWIALAGNEHKFARNLFEALQRPDLIDAAIGPPGEGQRAVTEFLRETFVARTMAEWERWFDGKDVAWGRVLDLREAFDHPHVAARGMRLVDDRGREHIGAPIRFRQESARPTFGAPGLGEGNEAAARLAGYDGAGVEALRASGAFGAKAD
ncbi:MAG: CaiB/BaiF CoA-transferase family protein [Burkholderiaceae bacterium]